MTARPHTYRNPVYHPFARIIGTGKVQPIRCRDCSDVRQAPVHQERLVDPDQRPLTELRDIAQARTGKRFISRPDWTGARYDSAGQVL
jgi:hypothetical protein